MILGCAGVLCKLREICVRKGTVCAAHISIRAPTLEVSAARAQSGANPIVTIRNDNGDSKLIADTGPKASFP
jgi:hypothetical protein